jgi:hypothetical protein
VNCKGPDSRRRRSSLSVFVGNKAVSCWRIITSEDSLNDSDLQKAVLIFFNTTSLLYQFACGGLLEKSMHETASYLTSTNANTVRKTQSTQFVNKTEKRLEARKNISKVLKLNKIKCRKDLKQRDLSYNVLTVMRNIR